MTRSISALYQHEGADFKHPRGGEAFYLHRPLLEKQDQYLGGFLRVIEGDATSVEVMTENVEDIALSVRTRAPVEFIVLRRSASPKVEDNGEEVYYRPAAIPRLTQEELNAIRRAGEPIVNLAEFLRQLHYHRGEGGNPPHPGSIFA